VGDARLRELERRALQGDPQARAAYAHECVRVGDLGFLTRLGPGPYDVRGLADVARDALSRASTGSRYPYLGFRVYRAPDAGVLRAHYESTRSGCPAGEVDTYLAFQEREARRQVGDPDGWRAALEAQDRPAAWLERSRRVRERDPVEACLALAAATWLEPGDATRAQAARLAPTLEHAIERGWAGQRDVHQGFKSKSFSDRHWAAWAMKTGATAAFVPALLANASEESFSIRARIYRSLGQRPHPASIQCLQEGTLDPHPFARAQAVRSLGWIGDPSRLDRLVELREADPDDEVRRAARKALERIGWYWLGYGRSPEEVAASPALQTELIRACLAQGLTWIVQELAESGCEGEELQGWLEALADPLHQFRREDRPPRYADYFTEANDEQARIEGGAEGSDLRHVPARLASSDPDVQVLGLLQASRHARHDLAGEIVELAASEHSAVAWHARRALRALDRGTLAQRRILPGGWSPSREA
jgi:HEAT repeat protein